MNGTNVKNVCSRHISRWKKYEHNEELFISDSSSPPHWFSKKIFVLGIGQENLESPNPNVKNISDCNGMYVVHHIPIFHLHYI